MAKSNTKPPPLTPQQIARYWSRVRKTPTCWIFGAGKGYGRIMFNWVIYGAHRLSYELTYGPIPSGLQACHKCDNPPCVNPDHLFLGTARDNAQDRNNKGRISSGEQHWTHRYPERLARGPRNGNYPRGKKNHATKLTEQDVQEIRVRYATGRSPNGLAKDFGVCRHTIRQILARETWKYVA